MAEARDKARNSSQSAKGKVKKAAGKVPGNKKLETKGRTDQGKAKMKKTSEKLKTRSAELRATAVDIGEALPGPQSREGFIHAHRAPKAARARSLNPRL